MMGWLAWEVKAGEDEAAEGVVQRKVDAVGHVNAEGALVLDGRICEANHGHLAGHTHWVQNQESCEAQPCQPVGGCSPFLHALA